MSDDNPIGGPDRLGLYDHSDDHNNGPEYFVPRSSGEDALSIIGAQSERIQKVKDMLQNAGIIAGGDVIENKPAVIQSEPQHPKVTMFDHLCFAPDGWPDGAYGAAITQCYSTDDGVFWAGNEEYYSQVNHCPFCGAKAPVQVDLKVKKRGKYSRERVKK